MDKKNYTVILVPHARAKFRKFQVSSLQLRLASMALVALGASSAYVTWSYLTAPIDGPFRGSVRIASMLGGGDGETLSFLKEKERSSPDIQFLTLPRYDPVILY